MPDFSGASLKLKAEGEEKVLATLDRIDKKARESVQGFARLSQDEVDKASAAFDRLYGKQSRSARQAQVVVEDVAKKVDASVGGMSHSAALGLGELARGLGRVAESGKLSAFAVREFTGSAFRLGAALGSAGLGAGVGLAAIAIGGLVEYFQNASKKADEMAQHVQQAFERIAHASTLLSASQEEQFAFSGDPLSRLVPKGKNESDIDFIKRTEGQLGLAKEAMRVRALLDKLNNPNTSAGEAAEIRAINLHGELTKRVEELDRAVGDLGMNMAIADQRRRQLNTTEEAAAKIALENAGKKRELKDIEQELQGVNERTKQAQREYNEVLRETNRELEEQEREQLRLIELQLEQQNEQTRNAKKQYEDATREATQALEATLRESESRSREIGNAIVRGITDGLRAAFSSRGGGILNGFKALTASILDGLGQMFAQVAEKALIGSQIMQRIAEAIGKFNPWVAAAAAVALMAFGNSLRSSGGNGGGGGGGGYGGSSLPQIVNTGVVSASAPQGPVTNASNITARPMQQNTFYVIGPDDPRAGRQIQQLLDNNARRG